MAHSVDEMRACIAREIRMREKSYPRWVAQGKLTKATADHELSCMYSVLEHLGGRAADQPSTDSRRQLDDLFSRRRS